MRAKFAAVFALGFAAGMAVLAILLGSTGHITGYGQEVATAATTTMPRRPEPPPASVPSTSVPPTSVPPTSVPPTLSAATRLGMPLANIDPQQLESTFNQARNGHTHEALDIMAPRGTPVMAVAEGNVVKLFTSKQGGLTVYQFDDSQTWCYYYAHLNGYAAGLKEGVLLRKGEVLGYVGSTGDASPSAPHLHFALFRLGAERHWWQGTAVDPLPFFK
jgi:murein DD-endopeptidase MepM/ murein hydrolase activator NlpD